MNHAKRVYKDFCRKDRERILAANPTIDQMIADHSYYRFCWAVNRACRIAGGRSKSNGYQPQIDYLIEALHELRRLKRQPNLSNLTKWVEKDLPHQIFSNYQLRKAIKQFNLLIASKSTDKET
jgi:hypothetical protein